MCYNIINNTGNSIPASKYVKSIKIKTVHYSAYNSCAYCTHPPTWNL